MPMQRAATCLLSLLPLLGVLPCAWSGAADEEGTCPTGENCGTEGTIGLEDGQPKTGAKKDYWPRSRGHPEAYGSTRLLGPTNLSAALTWTWENPDMQILPGGVLLDGDRNIYVTAMDGIWKFTATGEILWTYTPNGLCQANPSLSDGVLFGASLSGYMFALDMVTGKELWSVKHSEGCEMDSPYVEVWDGVVLNACGRGMSETWWLPGNKHIMGARAVDGKKLWEFRSDRIHWNFMPIFVGDGSFLVMDIHGGIYRRSVKTGDLIWHTPESPEHNGSFTDGGLILAPGGRLAYTCSNTREGTDNEGALRAYEVSTGKLLWDEELPQPCVSWPAVDPDNRIVVVPIGPLPIPVAPTVLLLQPWLGLILAGLIMHIYSCFASWLCRKKFARVRNFCCKMNVCFLCTFLLLPLLHLWSIQLGQEQHKLWLSHKRPMLVCAFDAQSGARRWCYDNIQPWGRINARMEEEELFSHILRGHHMRPVCGPASWSAPTIDGRGTVYVSGMNGIFYAIRDANEDGIIDNETEVSTLDVEFASLHPGTSFAPGMMVLGTCRRVYVFNTSLAM